MTLNKILQRQLTRHYGAPENVPENLKPFLKVISETYDHSERDRKMLERSIELSSSEMKELNTMLRKETEQLINANRLYSFTSHINQTIVHIDDEETLFSEACRIAIEIGKFKIAWIGKIDRSRKRLKLLSQQGIHPDDLPHFENFRYDDNDPQAYVLKHEQSCICNDMAELDELSGWRGFALERGWGSYIVLPIKKSGKIVATMNICAAGRHFFNAAEVALLEEATGDISFALTVFEKEKERAETEAKLKESELRLKQAQAMAHFGSWVLDFSTGTAVWSEEALRIYGLPAEETQQSYQSWMSFIHPEDKAYVAKVTGEAQATLSSSNFFHRIILHDNSVRHIHSRAWYQFDGNGRPIGLYGVAHDVTSLMETQIALRQSKANLRLIVDLIPQAIFAMEEDGKFVFANKSFAELYGRHPREIVNKKLADLLPNEKLVQDFLQQAHEVISSNITSIVPEMPFTDHLGRQRMFHSTKVPFSPTGKNQRTMLGISMDITDQKIAEAEKAKIVADIVQRNKDLEQFSYIVSHNLRAPVANIMGLTELLLLEDKNSDQVLLNGLSMSVRKLDVVINDLNYILQAKQEVNENKETVYLSELIADIKLSIDSLLRSEEVKIDYNFSDADKLVTIKSYLYSILFNLVSNSIKYRKPDVHPVINIESKRQDKKITLIFTDNGLGIDLKRKGEQIFGLYKRFHYHTEGKGMGLYMVKTQVETLGGKISVDSEVNIGTTFTIEFEAA